MGWKPRLNLSRDNRRIFWAMAFSEGAYSLYITLWPLYIASLGATPPQIGLVIGLIGIFRLLALLPSGMLSDRFSPRLIIVVGRLATAVALLLYSLALDWWQLLPTGVIQAAGTLAFPAILATIAASAGDRRQRLRSFTLVNTVAPSIGLLIAPALGGLIAEVLGLRAVFVTAAILAACAVGFFSTISPGSPPVPDGAKVTYGSALAERPIRLLLIMHMLAVFVLTLGLTLVPNYLQDEHGISTGLIGVFGSIGAVGSIALGILVNRLRILQRPLTAVLVSIASVALALVIFATGSSLWLFSLAFLLQGGFFATWSFFEVALSEVTPERLRARTYALAEILAGSGFSLAPFLSGWLYDREPLLPVVASLILTVPLLIVIPLVARTLGRAGAVQLADEPA